MTVPPFRPFSCDAAIRAVGEGLLARTMPRAAWTHEAHFGALIWLLRETDIDVDARIGNVIRGYNLAVGGVNDDHHGYHDTITRCYIVGGRWHLAARSANEPLAASVNALLASPIGRRDWPLRFYSRGLLFSVAARRAFVMPDLAPFPTA